MRERRELEARIKELTIRVASNRWSDGANRSFRSEILVLQWVLGGPPTWNRYWATHQQQYLLEQLDVVGASVS